MITMRNSASHFTRAVRVLVGAAVAFALAGVASPASAVEITTGAGQSTGGQEDACWMEAEGRSACAATQEELAQLVYDEYGVVFVAPASGKTLPDTLRPPREANVATATATYVMGIIYSDGGMSGASFTQTTSLESEPCDAYGDYMYGNVDSLAVIDGYFGFNWNDRVSSFEGYGMCGYELWIDSNWKGSSFGPLGSAGSLGAFNDQASSLKVRKVA